MSQLSGKITRMSKVNLDALIPREDFTSSSSDSEKKQSNFQKLGLSHLLPNSDSNFTSLYHLLRKPDFQRETNEWDKQRIADLIDCFINRAFVPSIILWENQNTGNIFVIDGAHRLSALIAYINDDYGDKEISQKFYGFNQIPPAELALAEETRTYINKNIGAFKEVMKEGGERANGLKTGGFELQIIHGDVDLAEDSFFKINQQGVVLSPTERELCKNRTKPACITTRIIIKGKAGAQYWRNFEASNQSVIEGLAQKLHTLLFEPPFSENVKSAILHHPLGGGVTNATPMMYELIKLKNPKFKIEKEILDSKGETTLLYLTWTRKLVWKMLSEWDGSLGLFPTIYFYNSAGVYIQSAFLGMAQLLIEKENFSGFLPLFIKVRGRMEDFLLEYKVFLTQINRKYGSKERSYRHMKGFYLNLIEILGANTELSNDDIIKELKKKYVYLNQFENDSEKSKSRKFSKDQKVSLLLAEDLKGMARCKICNGYLHPLSKDFDHKVDLKFGGGSEDSNAQTTHRYCNKSKDLLINLGIYSPETVENI